MAPHPGLRSRQSAIASRRSQSGPRPAASRGGSTLLIVLVLMGMLMLLGVMFYTFATQELGSAQNYSEAAKADLPAADVDALMDFAMEQLIVGPDPKYKNSALWGRRHALIPNMLGNDVHPFNGRGVRVVRDVGGNLGVDLNNDGMADTGSVTDLYGNTVATNGAGTSLPGDLLDFNDSPAAHQGFERSLGQFPAPDVDYTYPDINNVFLSYDGYEPGGARVIIPSFHRPQLLRNGGAAITDWNTNSLMAKRVMRAHPSHNYVPKPGQSGSAATSRYLSGAGGFPFTPPDSQLPAGTIDQGVWTPGPADASNPTRRPEFDVDNDGDGVYEGVWLDVDFPPQELPDGTLYIPMVSFTVKELDGLLNLNVHGNLARVWSGEATLQAPFQHSPAVNNPNDVFISKSNLGLSPSEINPLWGFNRNPGTMPSEGTYDSTQDDLFNRTAPTGWAEIANREWLALLAGRYVRAPELTPGRFGEENILYRAVDSATGAPVSTTGAVQLRNFPGPGQAQVDDNGNLQGDWGGTSTGQMVPAFGHPLDFLGLGSRANQGNNPINPKIGQLGAFGSAAWPSYNWYSVSGTVPMPYAAVIGGFNGAYNDTLFNDLQEMVFDQSEKRDEDNLFGPDELRALHLSPADYGEAVGGKTRLTTLAPYNIDPNTATYGPNRDSQHFRQKFTTESWDRKNFSWVQHPNRMWEFNADADGDGRLEFPPQFGAATPYSATDPFRPLLRSQLEMEMGDQTGGRRQFRFSVNHLLTDVNGNPNPAFNTSVLPPNLQLGQRQLTPHPEDPSELVALGATPVPSAGANSYPGNGNFNGNPQLKEYWARRDRQLMARDIYVMLYAFGGLEGVNPTNASPAYTPEQCRQMAQFAVNLVDSLDRDNVLSRFEYDVDLSDGWGLDDDPYTIDADPDRGEVWGTERLDVTLSETMAVLTPTTAATSDYGFTQWQDDQPQPYFMYVELRNPSPFDVNLSNGAWQLEVAPYDATMSTAPLYNSPDIRRLRLMNGTIPAGDRFLIGSASVAVAGSAFPSILKVNPNHSTAPLTSVTDFDSTQSTWIAPSQNRPLDLDLLDSTKASWYELQDGMGTVPPSPALLDSVVPNISVNRQLDVRLCRRAFPDRPAPTNAIQEQDNPWVYVDSLSIPQVKELSFDSADSDAQIQQKLMDNSKSFERREPFAGSSGEGEYDPLANNSANVNPPPANSYIANTLGADNCRFVGSAGPWRWQHHFDRDFASLAEVLMVPVGNGAGPTYDDPAAPIHGNAGMARIIGNGFETYVNQVTNDRIGNAGAKFLVPRHPATPGTELNHWHRVWELLEIPTRTHVGISGFRDPLDYPRVPGKINLNMVRHPEVLAGLLDDPTLIQLDLGTPLTPGVMDQTSDGRANYWGALLRSRDGKRALGAAPGPDLVTGLYLPGTADSTPFRSASLVDTSTTQLDLESSVLRPWEGDSSAVSADPRRFFELGSITQHSESNMGLDPDANVLDDQPVEPALRDRFTGKILNNTTTRSNTFVVFVSIKKFRAVDNGSGVIQIGESIRSGGTDIENALPEYRGFFVVDRSQPERGYDPSTGTFSFRDFIMFRQIIQNLEEN